LQFEDSSIAPVSLDELKPWTEIPGARFFSGRGVYEAEFPFAAKLPPDVGVVLDLGGVRETAEVWINDAAAGVAWMRPYRFDVTRLVRPGPNRLRIAVTNLMINRVLGMGPIDYSAVYERFGRRFPPSRSPRACLGRCGWSSTKSFAAGGPAHAKNRASVHGARSRKSGHRYNSQYR
jgi:hypothetical protein